MSTLERAIMIAAEGHAGVKDRGGAPYILHPLRMMLGLSSPDERIVAVLHDVCEDCPGWTFDRLRDEGFSDEVIAAQRFLSPSAPILLPRWRAWSARSRSRTRPQFQWTAHRNASRSAAAG